MFLSIKMCGQPVGTTELHYSSKKREHSHSENISFVQHSSEYETSVNVHHIT